MISLNEINLLTYAIYKLRSALLQSAPSDDVIIIDYMRDAKLACEMALEKIKADTDVARVEAALDHHPELDAAFAKLGVRQP